GGEAHAPVAELDQALDQIGRLQRVALTTALGGDVAVARLLHGLDADEADREAAAAGVSLDVDDDRVAVVDVDHPRLPDPAAGARAVGPAGPGGGSRRRRPEAEGEGADHDGDGCEDGDVEAVHALPRAVDLRSLSASPAETSIP